MQNITYPHLVQQDGIWRIVALDQWDPTAVSIPIRYRKLSELDVKIFAHVRDYFHVFRNDPNDCLTTPKSSFGMRSPYQNVPDQTVPYTRALLCMWKDISYHNFIVHPAHIYIGRMCDTKSCRNPNHQTFGRRKAKGKNIWETGDVLDSVPPDRETEDWIDYSEGVRAEIVEALEAGTDPKSIELEMISRNSWDRPLPPYALVSYPSVEDFIKITIRDILKPPAVMPKQDTAQVAEAVSAMQDIKDLLKRKE